MNQSIKTLIYVVEPAKYLQKNMAVSRKMSVKIKTLQIKDEDVLGNIGIVIEMIKIKLSE